MSGGKASGNQAVQYTLVDHMPGVEGPVYETFRNFAAEGMQVPQSAVGAAPEKLAYLFAPPGDIMFQGNFDALRRQAEEEEKYCLVNIQKRQEFASQMLNRDTWPDENVRAIMGFRFLLSNAVVQCCPHQRPSTSSTTCTSTDAAGTTSRWCQPR